MGRQRNRSQMKEQNKAPEKEFTKMETSNLPDAEFKPLTVKILKKLRRRVNKFSGNFNKETEYIKIGRQPK